MRDLRRSQLQLWRDVMKLNRVHIFQPWNAERLSADAEIEVPNLGVVKIQHALSDETISRIEAESLAALRFKLGQSISENQPSK
jgi:hypothetical protein